MCYSEQLAAPLCHASFTFHSRFIPGSEERLWAAGAAWACHSTTVSNLLCAARCPWSRSRREDNLKKNNNHQGKLHERVCRKSVLSESFAFQLLCFPQPVIIKTRSPHLEHIDVTISLSSSNFARVFLSSDFRLPTMTSLLINSQLTNWPLRAECAAFTHSASVFMSLHCLQIVANARRTNSAWKHNKISSESHYSWACHLVELPLHFSPTHSDTPDLFCLKFQRRMSVPQKASQRGDVEERNAALQNRTISSRMLLLITYDYSQMPGRSGRRAVLLRGNRGQCWAALCCAAGRTPCQVKFAASCAPGLCCVLKQLVCAPEQRCSTHSDWDRWKHAGRASALMDYCLCDVFAFGD